MGDGDGKGVVYTLSLVSVFRGVAVSVLVTFLPVYAVSVGLGLPEIAGVVAIASGVGVASTPLFGFVADVVGRRIVLFASCVLLSLASIVVFLVGGYFGVFSAYVLFNIAINSWVPARAASIAGSVGEESMGFSFALLSLVFQLSRMITPFISGLLIVSHGYVVVFMFASAMAALAAATTLILVSEVASNATSNTDRRFSLRGFLRTLIPCRREAWFLVFLCIDRASWRLWIPILNSYMKAILGFAEDIIGLVNMFRGISSAIGVLPLGKLVDKYGWFPAIVLSEVTAVVAVALILSANDVIVMSLAMAFIGLSIASWVPGYNVAVSTITPNRDELARTYARANFYRSLAAIPSPWIGGILYSTAITLPFATSILLFVVGTVILVVKQVLGKQ